MNNGIDEQLTNHGWRYFIDILPIQSVDSCTQLNIPQNKLVCLFLLLLDWSLVLALVQKQALGLALEQGALRHCGKQVVTSKKRKSIGRRDMLVFVREHPPGQKLIARYLVNRRLASCHHGTVASCRFRQGKAQCVYIVFRCIKPQADCLVEETMRTLEHQFLHHILLSLPCFSRNKAETGCTTATRSICTASLKRREQRCFSSFTRSQTCCHCTLCCGHPYEHLLQGARLPRHPRR